MQPLHNIRVIEFGTMIAAPAAAALLASYGAQVIKVEDTATGDQLRLYGSSKGGTSGWFLSANAGKRSIAIDLKNDDGVEVAANLIDQADVLIEGYRDGVMARLGLGATAMRARNPRLIYCSSSGFGADGPYAGRPVYDPLIQALSGWAGAQRVDEQPTLVRGMVADKIGAYNNAQAILAALVQRGTTGAGCTVQTNMLDANIAFLWGDVMMEETLQDADVDHRANLIYSYRLYRAADGWVSIAIGTDKQWAAACEALGQPERLEDERFRTAAKRAAQLPDWYDVIDAMIGAMPAATVAERLIAADVPAAPVRAPGEVFADPQVRAVGLVQESEHPVAGRFRHPRSRSAQFGTAEPLLPAPGWGQHSRAILAELGYDRDRQQRLIDSGAVRTDG
jgi:crotonobetainyl-CoA:carnitine CoA-transferase CaiB-like acyl-CoA transferase